MAKIKMDTLFILISHKVSQGTPERAREYFEAFRDVLYEQLAQNDTCYCYGLGEFKKAINPHTGKRRDVYNFGEERFENRFVEPKYSVGFKIESRFLQGLNEGEETYPKKKSKRKYKPKEYQEIRNDRRRKKPQSLESWLDDLVNNVQYSAMDKKEKEDGEENGSI